MPLRVPVDRIRVSYTHLQGMHGFVENKELVIPDIDQALREPTDKRIFVISKAFRAGYTVDQVHELTKIDKWFLELSLIHICKVSELEAFAVQKDISGNIGIAHTRWATHGEPCSVNAHPHYSSSKRLALIHNGIIENYAVLKEKLQTKGYTFQSNTCLLYTSDFSQRAGQIRPVNSGKSFVSFST